MRKLIKEIPVKNAELFVISDGNRISIADFEGRIDIFEDKKLIPVLGQLKKGIKSICLSFIVSKDIEYRKENALELINSANIFESTGECLGEAIRFYDLEFVDNDPITNELQFEIKDLKLIERLLKNYDSSMLN